MTEDPTEVRLIVANVAHTVFQGPGGSETYSGTKHFSAGTRAHVADAYWGDAGEAVQVIGLARQSRRLIHVTIAARSMYNYRVVTVARPSVLRMLRDRGSSYLEHPQSDEALFQSTVGLSCYYWFQALRGRITAALGLETTMHLMDIRMGGRPDRTRYSYLADYHRRRCERRSQALDP